MAYESPINVWWSDTKIEKLRDEYDQLIVRAVKNVCPQVNKDELIKALEYDRGQYEKGFADGLAFKPSATTNADRIRAMSDEELAEFIADVTTETNYCGIRCRSYKEGCTYSDSTCRSAWLDWLRQEVTP